MGWRSPAKARSVSYTHLDVYKRQIVTSIKKVSDIVAEMAAAAREQATGIEQVNKAILQMDQVTQQNAALVEQTAAASHSMGDQAQELQRLMGFFRLDGQGSSAPVPTAATRPKAASKAPAVLRSVQGGDQRMAAAAVKLASAKVRPLAEKKLATMAAGAAEEWEAF